MFAYIFKPFNIYPCNMKKALLLYFSLCLAMTSYGQQVFINEIHYDNDGTDVNEGIEIAAPAGTDLSSYALVAYNGNGGSPYSTTNLSGIITDQSNGYGTAFFAISGLQNGSPDGIALYDGTTVLQFLSYEGSFTAVGGVADSLTSTDIGVSQSSATIGSSLQLAGEGTSYEDFTWEADSTSSYGAININQVIGTAIPVLFINEIHYDNASSDLNEGVEVAGTAGLDLAGWSLVAYNGNGGTSYGTTALSGTLGDLDNGYGTAFFAISGLQNGAPDGIALVNPEDTVIQFLSYEGSFTATDGPASGLTSEDILVSESSSTPVDYSLQLTGVGTSYVDFTWAAEMLSTYDSINTSQSFGTDTTTVPVDTAQVIGTVFINEIHYDNASSDIDEGVEIAGTAGIDLAGYSIEIYNGNGGASYGNTALSGILVDQQAGFGTLFFPISGLQNGAPDGLALVDPNGVVLEFLSYEGSLVATDGPASGLTSTDIGVSETSSTVVGNSLQLIGTGSIAADFTWSGPIASTYDSINTGQTFVSPEAIVFINEIHYDNASSDVDESVEVAGTAGTDLSGWSLVLYNGNGGAAYNTTALSGILPDQDNGYGTLAFAISGIQNGAPDGIALVNADGEVVEFLSYEGTLIATDGPASGLTSTDLGVSETSSTPVGFSLQLVGSGSSSIDFTWSDAIASTSGAVNTGQSFGGGVIVTPPTSDTVTVAQARALSVGSEVVFLATLTATDQFGGPAYLQDSTAGIGLFDSQVHGDGLFNIGDQIWVKGEIGTFSNQIQLINVDTVALVDTATVAPTVVTLSELADYEGQLITIENITFDSPNGLLYPNSNYDITDSTGTAELRIDADVDLVGRLVPTGVTSVTGVLGRFQTTLQILPRFIPDLPDAEVYTPAGSDIPFDNTIDIATWNMEFFGTELSNFGPSDVQLQKDNAVTVLENLNADIIAVQEVSEESMLDSVLMELPQYQYVCSQVYSYSFAEEDPSNPFPAQKLCFIYDTATVDFISDQVIFDQFYTDARTGLIADLDNHPGGSAQSFWSSGRLPYMMTAAVTVQGVTKEISLVNLHAKSGSSANDLARKVYDIGALKDTLDAQYDSQNVIVLGDYNDDLDESIGGGPSTYEAFLIDSIGYDAPTLSLSEAGFRSFLFADNMIDHITISDNLFGDIISGSESIFIPFNTIDNFSGTTSDHLPVSVRFDVVDPISLSISASTSEVFYGYEPLETSTLTATIAGGVAPYTYSWSTGDSTAQITVNPMENMVYVLNVADASGQYATDSLSIEATDISCGRYDDKVSLCWNGRNICVSAYAVEQLLAKGASLGTCSEEDLPFIKRLKVNPNPFYRNITLYINANKSFDMNILVTDFYGNQVFNTTVEVSAGYSCNSYDLSHARRGFYILQLINSTTGDVERTMRIYKRR